MVRTSGRQINPRRIRILVPILVVAAIALYFVLPRTRGDLNRIEGSGTIEATQVSIAPKVAGRVVSLNAREGHTVRPGQVIAELDHDELDAQVAQARAGVVAAASRLAQAEAALSVQQTQASASVEQARAAVDASRTRVPQASETAELQQASVNAQIEQARAQVKAAAAQVAAADAAVRAADANLQAAEAALVRAQSDAARTEALFRAGAVAAQQVDLARTALATAISQRDAVRAQQDAARAQREAAASVLGQAEAALNVALANRRTVSIRQLDVTASRAQVTQAEAALRNAQSATGLVAQRAREVDAARAAVAQARASLDLAMTSRNNAVLRAPIAGTVLSRNVEVGDLVTAGSPVMTIGDLTSPYLRIFVAETDLGRVKLGQAAEVRVDAFPNRVIRGTVEEISNRAEFTPGNVQTKEARVKLVFGVKIVLPNPDGILKPGLPADAAILVNSLASR
ncbi:MAG TPA: HlyD family efflux transporter periplasmic adaptor subunit [bacterium]|nr:HlyD family efflux transporter periplasmic adaptor subunit [bacterium]